MGGKINILNENFHFFCVERVFNFLSQIGRDLCFLKFLLCATIAIARQRCVRPTHATTHYDTGCQQNVISALCNLTQVLTATRVLAEVAIRQPQAG
jgi:hypothetical protein